MQSLYIEKACEACELADYVLELERMLSEHCLESSKMAERRIESSNPATLWKLEIQHYGKITCNFVEKVLAKKHKRTVPLCLSHSLASLLIYHFPLCNYLAKKSILSLHKGFNLIGGINKQVDADFWHN